MPIIGRADVDQGLSHLNSNSETKAGRQGWASVTTAAEKDR